MTRREFRAAVDRARRAALALADDAETAAAFATDAKVHADLASGASLVKARSALFRAAREVAAARKRGLAVQKGLRGLGRASKTLDGEDER